MGGEIERAPRKSLGHQQTGQKRKSSMEQFAVKLVKTGVLAMVLFSINVPVRNSDY